ncbi:MAG: hypothetical protein LBE71_01155, partial [Dysgonamonadaceae bacterium]|nr:hypothetical protein [Dysgonamonadaceae bacterium]
KKIVNRKRSNPEEKKRHCERSEAIQRNRTPLAASWLAMTRRGYNSEILYNAQVDKIILIFILSKAK